MAHLMLGVTDELKGGLVLLFPRHSSKILGKHPSHTWGPARICLVIIHAMSLYVPYNIQEWMSKIKESHSNGHRLPLM